MKAKSMSMRNHQIAGDLNGVHVKQLKCTYLVVRFMARSFGAKKFHFAPSFRFYVVSWSLAYTANFHNVGRALR